MNMISPEVKMHVIIPTKNRANTLEWSLKTALNQDHPFYTVWVSDNFSEDNTKEIALGYNDPRVKYINPGKRLSMSAHWEFALDHIDEGYVMILGDDDGLYPNAVSKAATLLNKHQMDAISWVYATYFWPGVGDLFHHPLSDIYTICNTKEIIKMVKNDLAKIRKLPGFYWGFINISLYKKIKERDGIFFNSCIPDYYSASVIAGSIDRFIYSDAAFSISGNSLNSEGGSFHHPEKYGKKRGQEFASENDRPVHPKMILGKDGVTALADAYLQASDRSPNLPELDMRGFLQQARSTISLHGTKQRYIESFELLKQVAEKNGLADFFNNEKPNYPTVEKGYIKKGSYSFGLNAIRFLPQDYMITNVSEASLFGSHLLYPLKLKYTGSLNKSSLSFYISRVKGLLYVTWLTFFTKHRKTLLGRYFYSFIGK